MAGISERCLLDGVPLLSLSVLLDSDSFVLDVLAETPSEPLPMAMGRRKKASMNNSDARTGVAFDAKEKQGDGKDGPHIHTSGSIDNTMAAKAMVELPPRG